MGMTFMYNESLVTTPCEDITISVIFTPEFSPRSENWQAITLVDLCGKGKVAPPKDEVTDMSSIHLKSEFAFLTVWGAGREQNGYSPERPYKCKQGDYFMTASKPVFLL